MLYPDCILEDKRNCGESLLRQGQMVMLRLLRIVDFICRENKISYWLDSGTLLGAVRHRGFIPWDDDIDIVMPRLDFERFIEIAKAQLPDSVMLDLRGERRDNHFALNPCKLRDLNSAILEPCSQESENNGIYIDIFPFDRFSPRNSLRFKYEKLLKLSYRSIGKLKDSVYYKDLSFSRRIYSFFNPLWLGLFSGYQKLAKREILVSQRRNSRGFQIGFGFDVPFCWYFDPDFIFPLKEAEFEGYKFFIPNKETHYLALFYGDNFMTLPPLDKRKSHAIKIIPDLKRFPEEVCSQ